MWRQQLKQLLDATVDLSCLSENNELKNKILGVIFNPRVRLKRLDVQQIVLDQQDPESLHVKKEEELWTNLEGKQLNVKETGATMISFPAVPLKSEDNPKSMRSHTDAMILADDQQMVLIKEEATEEWIPDVDQQEPDPLHIKKEDEKEELWTSLEGEQLSVKETDATMISFPAVPLKTVDKEECMRIHTGEGLFACDLCGQGFTKKTILNKHMRIHTKKKLFGCDVCKQKFGRKEILNRHMIIHTGDRPFACDLCGHGFTQKTNLNKHKKIHKEERLFACDLCGQGFTKEAILNKHMIIHAEQKLFGCDVCGQKFGRKENLNRHVIIHTGERPFSCDFCGQRFTQKTNLNKHLRIHTGERPFACDLCGQRFTQKTNVNKHMETHTGQKRFDCEICGQRFTQKASLVKHKIVHTGEKPFSCEVCAHRFTQKASLVKHKRIHTGEKPFSCEVCGQRFARKATLVTHKRIHTGEKPFACDVCARRFNQKGHLSAHVKIHTVLPADVQHMMLIKEVPEEYGLDVDQQEPEPLRIKEEEEELWTSLEGEQLSVNEETDATGAIVTAVSLKSDDDEEKPLLSQLLHQMDDGELPNSSSADQVKADSGGENCRGAKTTRNPDLKTHEDDSSSSETEVSGDDEEDVDNPDLSETSTRIWARN